MSLKINKLFIFTLFAALTIIDADFASAKTKPIKITDYFNTVKIGGKFKVIYSVTEDTLKIDAADRVIKNIEFVVEDNQLNVRYKEGESVSAILGGKTPVIYLPVSDDIEKLILAGATTLEIPAPVIQDSLSFDLFGAAKVIGKIHTEGLSIYCAGAVNATITGYSKNVSIKIDGASRVVMGEGFGCEYCNLNINGAGIVRVNCTEKISGQISGTSVVKYLGEPRLTIRKNGLASISPL